MADKCPGHIRHWFTQRGSVSLRLPRCVRCGERNPNWETQRPKMVAMIGEDEVFAVEVEMTAAL